MAKFEPGLLPTAVGSLPHTDPQRACSLVLKYLPQIPAWPQLPKRAFSETMYVQFVPDFPGTKVEGERLYIETSREDIDTELSKLLEDAQARAIEQYAMAQEYAMGLYALLAAGPGGASMVKGQITGPISCGLSLTDENRKPIIYNDIIADALAKHLSLKAAWQEVRLSTLKRPTMLWVDEPYLHALGSAFVSLPREQVVGLLEQVLGAISGIKGVHCCGNTDWSLLLGSSIDVLSFDAYNYPQPLSLYPQEVKAFLERGGVIAWGIVPNDEANLAKEALGSLQDRLEEAIAPFTRKGITFPQLVRQGLLTPSCGISGLSLDGAERALELLSQLSQRMRGKYGKYLS